MEPKAEVSRDEEKDGCIVVPSGLVSPSVLAMVATGGEACEGN